MNGKVEVSNWEINSILAKNLDANRIDWVTVLDDAFCTYQRAFNTPIGASPYQLMDDKSCHFPIKLEYKVCEHWKGRIWNSMLWQK